MDGNRRPGAQGLFSFLFDEFRSAVQDIRQKVVEEGWFGRVVTPAPVVEMDHTLASRRGGLYSDDHRPLANDSPASSDRRPSFEELWRAREPGEKAAEIKKDHGIDIDR